MRSERGEVIEFDEYGRRWVNGHREGAPDVIWPGLCVRPPEGWWCSRAPGHPGPCAASPTEKVVTE